MESSRFKFRAWIPSEKSMIQWDDLRDTQAFNDGFDGNDCDLMQFTGLRDRNGKEIYEGDILSRNRFVDWVVVWEKYGFHIYNKFTPEQKFPLLEAIEREVIGNIYEGEPCQDTSKP